MCIRDRPQPAGPFGGTYGGKPYAASGEPPYALSDQQKEFMEREHIRHILMITVQDAGTAARWSNALQARAESLPHGIPVNISSDPRNGARGNSGMEFKTGGSDVSRWPEGVGFAACFDPAVVRQFAEDASREYRALGITTALGPQIDLCTEPRWMRFVDTLGENVEMTCLLYTSADIFLCAGPDRLGTLLLNIFVRRYKLSGEYVWYRWQRLHRFYRTLLSCREFYFIDYLFLLCHPGGLEKVPQNCSSKKNAFSCNGCCGLCGDPYFFHCLPGQCNL